MAGPINLKIKVVTPDAWRPEHGKGCYFCYTGSVGSEDVSKTWGDGNYHYVCDLLREGPNAEPTHAICKECFDTNQHRQRRRCQQCGKLALLLRTANDSMTNKWADIGPEHIHLCEDCQTMLWCPESNSWMFSPQISAVMPFTTNKVTMTDDDVEVLRRLWELPDCQTRTKMPVLHRRIDDD